MKKALLPAALLIAGCVPSLLKPKALGEDLKRLEALAERADKAHERSCTPPPNPFPPSTAGGEPPSARPAVCGVLETCVSDLAEAARSCRDAIKAGAERVALRAYLDQAAGCRGARDAARQKCQAAHLEVPTWP